MDRKMEKLNGNWDYLGDDKLQSRPPSVHIGFRI